MNEPKIAWIATDAALEDLAGQLLAAEAVALDTEFFWERTYYPVLGLVQIAAAPDGCWLIDAVHLHDLRALAPVLSSPDVVKILHDAPQDLAILRRACGVAPRRIFDTRLAAGFAGLDSTASLQRLLREVLGVELDKGETRSDWLRRPLRPSQLHYAAEDVHHLVALRAALIDLCRDDEVRGWLREEQARLDDPALTAERDPGDAYTRVKGAARFSRRQLAQLRELAAWRESEARRRDWPRGHLLSDRALMEIVTREPRDLRALMTLPDVPARLPGDVAVQILDALARGRDLPETSWPEPLAGESRDAALLARAARFLEQVRTICAERGIDPALVATQADARAIAAGAPLRGWRSELAGAWAVT